MIKCDYHVHTCFCDGNSTPREIVESAVEKGFERIGFSGHGFTPFDQSYCMTREGIKEYIATIKALKEEYKGKIEILCGVEQDLFSGNPEGDFDYVIGSAHYVKKGDELLVVDITKEIFLKNVQDYFDGDVYAFCEGYFEGLAQVVEQTGADIIGHFDLISKYNEGDAVFDSSHPRYVAAWQKAADRLIKTGKPFEINTGAISRGYRTTPYPAKDMIEYITSKGGRFIMNSDSHSADTIGFELDRFEKWALNLGATLVDRF